MDDYTREMMDLKTLVTRTLEKKGVLAKIRAELRASVFEAIEEEDRVVENEDGVPPALLGSCNDRAKQLHASPSGRLLTALICEYLDWAQLGHTLKVYLPECNLQKDFWKAELREFSIKNGYDLNRNGESGPLLLDVLEGFLKFENLSQARGNGRRQIAPETESVSNSESRNIRRPSSSSVAGGIPPLGRPAPASQASDRRIGSSMPGYRKDEYNWRYDTDEFSEDVIQASNALENIQLDRKARNLTTSWRQNLTETELSTFLFPPGQLPFSLGLRSSLDCTCKRGIGMPGMEYLRMKATQIISNALHFPCCDQLMQEPSQVSVGFSLHPSSKLSMDKKQENSNLQN
ncbi:LisH dimerization motif [Macleaya cordata]|uniref:LisH dimerization motif n=1 Tax=Macleaya cordata TaxID=56857 RepID=A0A200QHN7_MACCD|nr:LisH dimerization motif [Macleaya cordata]